MPTKFFVTHSWKDIDFARKLCDDLTAHGLSGFLDAHSISPGDSIPLRIERGLTECDVYIPIFSPDALQSDWCDWEIDMAITMNRTLKGRPRIIPVIARPCKVPNRLIHLLRVDFAERRYDDALRELLTRGLGVSAPTPAPGERILIPAGEFLMGSDEYDNEKPPHKVRLDPFYIDRYPVTNADYRKFVDATKYKAIPGHWERGQIPAGKENHPVVYISWEDALAYSQWAGGRLPTEAEWEKAASWDDHKKEKRRYPWNNEFDKDKCNTRESGIGDTTPVGKYPAGESPYHVMDMAGNVWEWCADWYQEGYYKNSPVRNPTGPDLGQFRSLRGGSWNLDRADARCAYRSGSDPGYRHDDVGFRVAESVP